MGLKISIPVTGFTEARGPGKSTLQFHSQAEMKASPSPCNPATMASSKTAACKKTRRHRAESEQARENQEEAIEILTELKSRKIACYFLGKCHQELKDYEKAIDYFERSKQADTKEFEILIDIAETQRMSGDLQGALKSIEKLSKAYDGEASLHYQWANCLDDLGEYEDALAHYNRALEINPSHPDTLFRLAYDFDLSGEDEKALEYYEKCIEEVPLYTNAMINLGIVYEDNGEYEKAVSCYETVLQSYPNHEIAKLYLKDSRAGINMHYDDDKVKKEDIEIEVLNIPISDFELSVRSKNCLERMNIKTLADLTQVSELELLSYNSGDGDSMVINKLVRLWAKLWRYVDMGMMT